MRGMLRPGALEYGMLKRKIVAAVAAGTIAALAAGLAPVMIARAMAPGEVPVIDGEWSQYGGGAARTHEGAGPDGLALYRRWGTVLPGPAHSPAA
ncbi:MAG: hypothetical protein ACM3WT_07020, partial [Bacillota bacterium]